uniref:ATP synthase mitochondrial F1 complex assembly factor 2 n=1 Tax=Gopherus agassizii TaxID=38772 RepID=A0A452H4F0_9SAUR
MWRSCQWLFYARPPQTPWLCLTPPVGGPSLSLLGTARTYTPPTERKRFYQNVSISQGEGGFEINLDNRKLKTPQAKLFTVPSEALAIAVATEWDSQQDTIKSYTMHLTTLCNTVLDNPSQRNKDQLIRAAVKFLETDTVCYRVEEPAGLVELQKNEWDPMIEWAEKRYNVEIGSSTSIMGPNIPARTKDTFTSHLASYNMWALQGIEYVITQLKSLILSMGLIDRHIPVEKAVQLSRLEEEYQVNYVPEQPYHSSSDNLSMTSGLPAQTTGHRTACYYRRRSLHQAASGQYGLSVQPLNSHDEQPKAL